MSAVFYTYRLHHPISYEPLYVGKGKGTRCKTHFRNKCKSHIANKLRKLKRETGLTAIIEIVADGLSEDEAFNLEIALIKFHGRKDLGTGPLYNKSRGGEGAAGQVVSASTREKLRRANLGKKASAATRQLLSDMFRGRSNTWGHKIAIGLKNHIVTEITRSRISNANKRYYQLHPDQAYKTCPNRGIPHKEESKLKMSLSVKVALARPETKERRSKANSMGNNPRAKPCIFKGVHYSCITEAAVATRISRSTIRGSSEFQYLNAK